ncbi:glycosyltransferase [Neolewinella lacunae]|uniref:Glycosyltransferase n=1 Tax=Neolewinella lacunae TaxID=1517758 RepID=A0A923TDC3_9BACT|nr:glycosyltransferase [Neolewinella lacunae]MBC6994677.1 glycosyltransferase [Neolewinella lacunae]MDN3634549.1 glycosyltransferase [Neolewinella lacunae]
MRILFLTPWFPNRVHARDGNFVERYAALAAEIGSVTLLHAVHDPKLGVGTLELHTEARIWGQLHQVYYGGQGGRWQRLRARRKAWRAAIAALTERPDVIYAHVLIDGGIVAARLARRWGVPFVVSEHASRYLEPGVPLRYAFDFMLARRAARRASWVLPVSTALRMGMEQKGIRANYRVLPNPVDDRFFVPASREASPGGRQMLHLSDASWQKNIGLLLDAFELAHREDPGLELVLAGDGNPVVLRRAIATHLGPAARRALRLRGPLDRSEVVSAMQSARLFVLTSTIETQGIVVLEALLCGLPVITTPCGGPQSLLQHPEDGSVLADFQPTTLAEAMLAWLARPAETDHARQQRAERARQAFGLERFRVDLREILGSLRG